MLSEAQRDAYLEKLGLAGVLGAQEDICAPTGGRGKPLPYGQPAAEGMCASTKENLDALVHAHQSRIPFSTLTVHRGGAAPDLSVDALFERVVTEGRGGYCFELNKLFEALLLSLGYEARPVLSRAVRGREGRMPINHRGIVVTLPDGDYSVDVGFGGPMPAGALRLEDGLEQDVRGEAYITEQTDDGWWKVDRITKAEADLYDDEVPVRRQTELELCTAAVEDIDFDALSLMCSQPGTLFRDHDVVNLRTVDGYKGYKDGVLIVRENGAKTVTEVSAAEEAAALAEHFGMRLA